MVPVINGFYAGTWAHIEGTRRGCKVFGVHEITFDSLWGCRERERAVKSWKQTFEVVLLSILLLFLFSSFSCSHSSFTPFSSPPLLLFTSPHPSPPHPSSLTSSSLSSPSPHPISREKNDNVELLRYQLQCLREKCARLESCEQQLVDAQLTTKAGGVWVQRMNGGVGMYVANSVSMHHIGVGGQG